MNEFANRVVLITGAGNGIGRHLARMLSEEGAAIAALDRAADGLASLAVEMPGRKIATAVADVTERSSLHAAVAQLREQLGPIDLLIANAGIGRETSALDYRASDIEEIIRVNLIGVVNSIEAVLPEMLARRSGHLVAMSSLASYRGIPRMSAYCASKSGLNAFFEALRVELKPSGIVTTTICPGWIRTAMTSSLAIDLPGLLEVDDAARRIIEAIRRKKRILAFPASTARRVKFLRWLPSGASDWVVSRLMRSMAKEW